MRTSHILISFFFVIGVLGAGVQGSRAQSVPLSFQSFDNLKLPNNTVWSIEQDFQGYLWFGTDEGLHRFDGYDLKSYKHNPRDTTSLADNRVTQIFEDTNQHLWIATQGGTLQVLNRGTDAFTPVFTPPDATENTYLLGPDDRGALWLFVQQAFYRYFGDVIQIWAQEDGVPTTNRTPDQVAGPIFWAGTQAQVVGLSAEEGLFFSFDATTLPEWQPDEVFIEWATTHTADAVWLVSSHSLYEFSPQTGTLTHRVTFPEDPEVKAQVHGQEGALWILRRNVYRFDLQTHELAQHRFVPGNRLATNTESILLDQNEVVWVGTLNGVYRALQTEASFANFGSAGEPPVLGSSIVTTFYQETADAPLWVGTIGGGLQRVDRATGTVEAFSMPVAYPNPNNLVWDIYDDGRYYWLGMDWGLARFDPQTEAVAFFPLPVAEYMPDQNPSDQLAHLTEVIAPAGDGQLWLSSFYGGLWLVDTRTMSFELHFPEVGSVSGLHIARDGALWIGTRKDGLFRLSPDRQTLKNYPHSLQDEQSLGGSHVWYIHEADDGMFWIGTTSGFSRFDPQTERFTNYFEDDGLPASVVYAILEDDMGRFWLSTNNGLACFHPEAPEGQQIRTFDTLDGIGNTEFNRRSAYIAPDGTFYFGGINGITAFTPSDVMQSTFKPPIVLNRITVNNQREINPFNQTELRLDHTEHDLVFEFAALDYTNAQRNQYAYMLENDDADWWQIGTRRFANYTNLSPGEYVFRVRGTNSDGRWNEESLALRISIAPPWWRTWWAYTLYGLMSVAFVIGVVRWRSWQLQRRNRDLEREVVQRTAEIAEQKDQLQTQNGTLEAQQVQLATQNAQLENQRGQLQLQADKLLDLDRMKSRFFANLSHEFRTPLSLIRSPIEHALGGEYGTLDPQLQDHLQISHRNTDRLQRLINQLLDLAKLEAGELKLRAREMDLVLFLRRLVGAFASLAERGMVNLQFSANVDACQVYIDEEKFDQVMTNLLSNALKFTPEQGEVAVHLVVPEAEAETDGPFIQIAVTDTGVGIPTEGISRIFDRFYQADHAASQAYEGTGIGLALTKELVELHGGDITVESRVDEGSTFSINIPLGREHLADDEIVVAEDVPPEAAPATRVQETASPPSETAQADVEEARPTILIVEDNLDLRQYLYSHFAEAYTVLEAGDGEEGLAVARETPPDLIISDVMMPKLDGLGLLEQIRADQNLRSIPVILLTARATQTDRIAGLAAQADAYIAKPFSVAELKVRVENLLTSRQVLRVQYGQRVISVSAEEVHLPDVDAEFLRRIQTVIETHLADSQFGVQRLAEEVYVSKRNLYRRLEDLTGLSPAAFIRKMRLQRAKQLIEQHAVKTVAEVAQTVGFSHVGYFSRLYRQTFGQSPNDLLAH